ncbi:FAD:protein FMN transferase [Paenibacillus sp. D2_2]|nr:FAD:protein FMN transferase [Paenibacillus sp. D2_2]WMT43263.1 FAD:protein FMN transferase [Paenibacillus sp. D2_2]
MKMKKAAILLVTMSIAASLLAGCGSSDNSASLSGSETQNQNVEPMKETYFIFDTVVNIKIYDNRATKKNLQEIDALLKEIDNKISRTNEKSEIYKVNMNAGIAPVQVSRIHLILWRMP